LWSVFPPFFERVARIKRSAMRDGLSRISLRSIRATD
jgi:hypothetical protein